MEWSNICIIIYLLAWITLVYVQIKRVRVVGPATMVMMSYSFYAILCLIYYNTEFQATNPNTPLTLFPFIYLFAMLYLALYPGLYFERSCVKTVQRPSSYIVDSFIIVYCICSIIQIPSILGQITSGITMILLESQGGADLYLEKSNRVLAVSDYAISGLNGMISIVHNVFQDISVFFVFYYLTLPKRKKILVILLTTIVLIDMLYSLSQGERNYVMMFFFMFAVGYFLFHDYIEEKVRAIVKKIALVLMGLMLVPFVAITISRFGESKNTTPIESAISYAGKAPVNFNAYVFHTDEIRYGDRTMNLFKKILGFDAPANHEEGHIKYPNLIIDDYTFYTFVGDFVMDFGLIFAAILFLVFSSMFSSLVRVRGRTMYLHQMLIIYFVLNICAQGGMYLFSYSYNGNWKIMGYIFMYFVLLTDSRSIPAKQRLFLIRNR